MPQVKVIIGSVFSSIIKHKVGDLIGPNVEEIKELDFIEMTRALGFPGGLISMESFRTPNFQLVADLLVWLVQRFDPEAEDNFPLENLAKSETARVTLIRNVAQFMAVKANLKLNTKRLYQSDGFAVKEMLKIVTLLYAALNENMEDEDENKRDDEDYTTSNWRDFDISDKVSELKLSRQLASEITTTGATLYDLLSNESELRPARHKSLSRQFELSDLELTLKKSIDKIKIEIDETRSQIENVSATESALDSKIERRKLEIDRYEKRLQTLKKVRPAFLEEFTVLEIELEQLFEQYSQRTRILNQLEKQFTEAERAQLDRQLEKTTPRVEIIPLEDNDLIDDLDSSATGTGTNGKHLQERPRASTGGNRTRTRTAKSTGNKSFGVVGNMQPSLSPSLSSADSEDDDLFMDKDESELLHSDDDSLGLELSGVESKMEGKMNGASRMQSNNSDDDF